MPKSGKLSKKTIKKNKAEKKSPPSSRLLPGFQKNIQKKHGKIKILVYTYQHVRSLKGEYEALKDVISKLKIFAENQKDWSDAAKAKIREKREALSQSDSGPKVAV